MNTSQLGSCSLMSPRLADDFPLRPETRQALTHTTVVFLGFGSLARPMSALLCSLGVRRFKLVDPKRYESRSIASQCRTDEVGRLKVDVGQERLRLQGALVDVLARDLFHVPDGWIDEECILVASLDNRRADVRANRIAARMRVRLIKLNVEPQYSLAAVRCYDFRSTYLTCAECQFGDQHYSQQRHPRSCDGPGDVKKHAMQRPTNTPRSLSRAAAGLGATALVALLSSPAAATCWLGRESQFDVDSGRFFQAELSANPQCRFEHGCGWQHLRRLGPGPGELSLAALLQQTGQSTDALTRVSFCQQISLSSRCRDCGNTIAAPHWYVDLDAPLEVCPQCGGPVMAVPFWSRSTTSIDSLRSVLALPLSNWGVEPGAILEIHQGGRSTAFVVGPQIARTGACL